MNVNRRHVIEKKVRITVNFPGSGLTVMLRSSNVASGPPTAVLVEAEIAASESASPTTVDSLGKGV